MNEQIKINNGLLVTNYFKSFSSQPLVEWDKLFNGCAEDLNYFKACEKADFSGFHFSGISIKKNGKLVGVTPIFECQFSMTIMYHEKLQPLIRHVEKLIPSLISPPSIGAGFPTTDELSLTIANDLDETGKEQVLGELLSELIRQANLSKTDRILVKDVSDYDSHRYGKIFEQYGFFKIPALPMAHFLVNQDSTDAYIQGLSAKRRRGLRVNLKKSKGVRLEITDCIEGIEDEIWELREQTRAKARAHYGDYEQLPNDYYKAINENMPHKLRFFKYFLEDELIGFVMVFLEKKRLVVKDLGMKYPVATKHGLYHFNWINLLEYAISNNLKWIQFGPTTYMTKVKLGCKLQRRWEYSRHRNGFMNHIEKYLSRYFSIANLDPDYKDLDQVEHFFDEAIDNEPAVIKTFDSHKI